MIKMMNRFIERSVSIYYKLGEVPQKLLGYLGFSLLLFFSWQSFVVLALDPLTVEALQKALYNFLEFSFFMSTGTVVFFIRRWWENKTQIDKLMQDDPFTKIDELASMLTERDEALRESEALLKAAMDQSQAGIAIADAPDGRLRYVNKAGLDIRGAPAEVAFDDVNKETYVSAWDLRYLDGTLCENTDVPLTIAINKGEVCRKEFIVRRPSGEDRYILAHAAPIFNSDGLVTAGIVVFLDVTDRRDAERALERSEEKFRKAIEYNTDAVVLVDTKGEVQYINNAMMTLTGLDELALLSTQFGFPLTTGDITSVDIVDSYGVPRCAEMRVSEIDLEGEHLYIVSLRDFTEVPEPCDGELVCPVKDYSYEDSSG